MWLVPGKHMHEDILIDKSIHRHKSTLQVLMLLFHFLCSSHNSEPSLEITDNFQKSLKVSIIRLNTTKQIKIFSKCR